MKSVRLNEWQQHRLREAARARGLNESEFIRQAIDKACADVLAGPSLYDQFKETFDWFDQDPIASDTPGDASRSEERWGDYVVRKHAPHLDTARRILEREQKSKAE